MGRSKKDNKRVPISATIDAALKPIIKEEANKKGMSVGLWIGKLIEDVLKSYNYKKDNIQAKEEDTSYNYNNKEDLPINEDPPSLNTYIPDLPFRIFLLDGKRTNMNTLAKEMNMSLDEIKEHLLTLEKSRIKKQS